MAPPKKIRQNHQKTNTQTQMQTMRLHLAKAGHATKKINNRRQGVNYEHQLGNPNP